MPKDDRWLLPDGIEEILPSEARRIETLRRRILDLFASWGYELVMPPLIEYLESLLTGVGKDMDLQTFKLTDQLTGRMMGVRPDTTPQAARIDAHYLKGEGTVRLCYAGSVLRTRPGAFAGSREPMQLGAELFGHGGPEADAEILSLMITTLDLAGVKNLHIDLGHVGVFRGLAAMAGLSPEEELALFEALQRKAHADAEALLADSSTGKNARRMLLALLDLNGGPEVLEDAGRCLKTAPGSVHAALAHLGAVAEQVTKHDPSRALHFDLAELSGYHYYTGIVFSVFVPGHGRAIAKGGRYDGIGKAFGRDRPATGFGADLRELARFSVSREEEIRGIMAPHTGDEQLWREVAHLRSIGERVIVRLPGDAATAADLGCDRELVAQDGRWIVQRLA